MTEFEYIAFDKKNGKAVAYGRNMLDVCSQADKLEGDACNSGTQIPSYVTLFCGRAGPYIWAEKLNLRRATIIVEMHITTQPVANNIPDTAAKLEKMRG